MQRDVLNCRTFGPIPTFLEASLSEPSHMANSEITRRWIIYSSTPSSMTPLIAVLVKATNLKLASSMRGNTFVIAPGAMRHCKE